MQINDDDIRAAFAWPVRYNKESECVHDFLSEPIIRVVSWSRTKRLATGEAIAEMLNERFAPRNADDFCGLCDHPFAAHDASNLRRCPMYSDLGAMIGYHPSSFFTPKGGE